LVNKPPKSYLNYSEEEVLNAANVIKSLSNDRRIPAQIAIQFVLHHPAIVSAVVGIRTNEQLDEAVNSLMVPPLSNSELEALKNSVSVKFYNDHR
jgi:aryl-alcohol dehydrogenase-like predicted oxidoreductase